MKPRYIFVTLSLYVFLLANLSLPSSASSSTKCKAWLVQSIPTDMPHLSQVSGVLSTGNVLKWLAGNSTKRLDIIAQYWQLLAHPDDPRSGGFGYSKQDMQRFGSQEGFDVHESLEDAADRNIRIRLQQHSGVYPDYTSEPLNLASGRPNVENVTLLLSDWWGSGIVHAKVWISDRRDAYIGSANNDWKSLIQVKEVGIYIVDCPKIVKKMEAYFDNLHLLILRIIQELYRITSGRVIEESLADRIFSTLKIGARKVEIKYYMVPGYNMTGPATHNGTSTGNIYPGYTRVNHGKFAVSDVRAHIGTSNLGERNFNRFGGWLGKNSTTGENVRLLEDLHVHLLASRESSSGKGTIRLEYLTPILKQLTNPLRLLPKDEAVKKVVEFMNVYSINPEDFDTIVELSKFQAPKKRIAAILEPSDDKIGEENGDVLAGSDEENSSDTEDQGDDATKSKKLQTELQSLNSKGVQVQLELKETKNSSTKKKQAGRGKGGSAASASSEKKGSLNFSINAIESTQAQPSSTSGCISTSISDVKWWCSGLFFNVSGAAAATAFMEEDVDHDRKKALNDCIKL
ncbi:hypothetical protein LWI28_019842 [Acer negundo]|uniref:PLD phosphodiesterase domain-containing protein n=1 Tax=Acer negundo TaxID=4023 RepID=A0AAD5JA67_ACENE|nr:hypothetical protein LWI28_019842 [Acer negundo]